MVSNQHLFIVLESFKKGTMFKTSIGLFRILSFTEGMTYLILLFIGMPVKKLWGIHEVSASIGPLHGGLFILFLIMTFLVAYQSKWSFSKTTWKVLLSCIIPFAFIYIDKKILKPQVQGTYSE